jgi:hypothetical protein
MELGAQVIEFLVILQKVCIGYNGLGVRKNILKLYKLMEEKQLLYCN